MTQCALFSSFFFAASLVVNKFLYRSDLVGSCWIEDLPFAVDTTFVVLTFVVVDKDAVDTAFVVLTFDEDAVDSRKEKY